MNRAQYVNIYKKLAQTKTRHVECIKMKRLDGMTFRFTAHDQPLRIRESDDLYHVYHPANSFQLTALETTTGLAVSNMDLDGMIDDDTITSADIIAGKFDHANVELFLAYWSNTTLGTLPLRTSWIGEIQAAGASFKTDLRGIAQKLAQVFIQTTSLECRHTFCDSNCTLDAADFTDTYNVTAAASTSEFRVGGVSTDDQKAYVWGLATFTSGLNEGLSMEIIHQNRGRLGLFLPLPNTIAVGDSVELVKGCSRAYSACEGFDNVRYFGGEPFLTGSDLLISYPQTFTEEKEKSAFRAAVDPLLSETENGGISGAVADALI